MERDGHATQNGSPPWVEDDIILGGLPDSSQSPFMHDLPFTLFDFGSGLFTEAESLSNCGNALGLDTLTAQTGSGLRDHQALHIQHPSMPPAPSLPHIITSGLHPHHRSLHTAAYTPTVSPLVNTPGLSPAGSGASPLTPNSGVMEMQNLSLFNHYLSPSPYSSQQSFWGPSPISSPSKSPQHLPILNFDPPTAQQSPALNQLPVPRPVSPYGQPTSPYIQPNSPYAQPASPYTHSIPSYPQLDEGSVPIIFDVNTINTAGPSITVSRARPLGVIELAQRFPRAQFLVPQLTYVPHTLSDRRRYVEEIDLLEPIMFLMKGGKECGIRCTDAMNGRVTDLVGRDDSMLEGRGPSVSIRIKWPGYPEWSRQIPTRDFRTPPQPVTRAKLAKNVAKTVARFLEEMKGRTMEGDDQRWKLSAGRIALDRLELVGLQHVSMGSWQIHLRLLPTTLHRA